AVAFSPDASQVLSGGNDKTLRLWDVKTGKEVRQFKGVTDMVRSVDISPDGRKAASGQYGPGSEFAVRIWDVKTGESERTMKGHTQDVTSVLFVPKKNRVLSAGMDGRVFVWDAAT